MSDPTTLNPTVIDTPTAPEGSPSLGDKMAGSAHDILDGLNEMTGALDITRDRHAEPDPEMGLGKKAAHAALGVVGTLNKPLDAIREVGGGLLIDGAQDIGLLPEDAQQKPESGYHLVDTVKDIGENIVKAPVEVPMALGRGAWKLTSGLASGITSLVTAPFETGSPQGPKPSGRPNRRALGNQAAMLMPDNDPDDTIESKRSLGAPSDIIPIGVRAPSTAQPNLTMGLRPQGPGF